MDEINPIIRKRQPYLKCDADGCGCRVPVEAISADDIGRPCPRCGSNLLTEGDFQAYERVMAAIDSLNAAAAVLGIRPEDGSTRIVEIGHHDGTTTIFADPET